MPIFTLPASQGDIVGAACLAHGIININKYKKLYKSPGKNNKL